MRSKTVALGLGSNLRIPIENLRQVLSEIKKNQFFEVLKVSAIYESDAQLPDNSISDWNKRFLNAAVLCRISDSVRAEDLLIEIKKIETKMGRVHSEKWAPRLIDIDVLYWSSEDCNSEKINIPHLRLCERPFALLPLLEIWPDIKLNLKLDLPNWTSEFVEVKPFNTIKSKKYFWPKMVGILNVSNDSFSDGGKYINSESLHNQFNLLINEGADIIDIGAESTRPGAINISEFEELEKLNWALAELNSSRPISLDCRRANVAEQVLEKHSISYLNDVSGFAQIEMKSLLKNSGLPAFVMHSLSVPPAADLILNIEKNPCEQLVNWWELRLKELTQFGISADKLIFDPGIGFGKNKLQNLFILQHLEQFSSIKNSVMIGHSRKSFLSLFSDRPAADRDLETALVTKDLNLAYVQYLRVHNIQSQLMALR
ncbi:MAG: dihydropteroate synthase [Bdellovibrionota bacterium]